MCKQYNGWSNYPTWNVALWLDNDHSSYLMVREWANDCDEVYELADRITDYVFVNEDNPLGDGASMFSDIMQFGLDSVNYFEIAKHIMEED